MPEEPAFAVGEIVLVRFEIRRAQPSDLGCWLARRAMGPMTALRDHRRAIIAGAFAYDWIPAGAIAGRERPLTLPAG